MAASEPHIPYPTIRPNRDPDTLAKAPANTSWLYLLLK